MEQPKGKYNDFWARKMKKVFRALDTSKKGYLSEVYLMESHDEWHKDYPQVQKDKLRAMQQNSWKVLFNNNNPIPPEHKLTEEMFINNMWITVNQPNFKELFAPTARGIFDAMDLKHDGYFTRDEYIKMNIKRAGEDVAQRTFDKMDTDKDGMVSFDEIMDSKVFYYTDLSDETHPFNLMNGPLEE